jgi:hypothetical protein
MKKKNKAQSSQSSVGIKERELEQSKAEDLKTIPQTTRENEIREAVVKNNVQSRYHGK